MTQSVSSSSVGSMSAKGLRSLNGSPLKRSGSRTRWPAAAAKRSASSRLFCQMPRMSGMKRIAVSDG
jgi:hypothetical protein